MAQQTLPELTSKSLAKLTPKAISRAVLKGSAGHNATLIPLGCAAVGGVGVVLFGGPLFIALAAGGAVVGLGSFLVNWVGRNTTLSREHICQVKKEIEQANEVYKNKVGPMLNDCLRYSEYRAQVEIAIEQFNNVIESFGSFMTVLGRKLDQHELTYGVFAGPAEEAANGIYDHLEEIVTIIMGIRSIDVANINKRIGQLKKISNPLPEDQETLKSLEERIRMHDEQVQRIRSILTENTKAITALEQATMEISKMQTEEKHGTIRMETALDELRKVADRSRLYGRN